MYKIDSFKVFSQICKDLELDPLRARFCKNFAFVPTKTGLFAYMDENYEVKEIDISIEDDSIFKANLQPFGLDTNGFYLFEDVIAIPTPQDEIFILMDRNFNIFAIVTSSKENIKSVSELVYKTYSNSLDYKDDSLTLPQPFEGMSLKTLMTIASRVEMVHDLERNTIDRRKLFLSVNKELLMPSKNDIHACLLILIKYLSMSSRFYYEKLYPLIISGLEVSVGTVGEYLVRVMENLFKMAKMAVQTGFDFDYQDVLIEIGQTELIDSLSEFLPATLEMIKRYYRGEISMGDLISATKDLESLLTLPDNVWRQKETESQLSQKDFESLFSNTPPNDKTMQIQEV